MERRLLVEQLSIYDELGFSDDPVYSLLASLTEDTSVVIGEFTIEKTNFGLYEIKSKDVHECMQTMELCYKKLNRYLSSMESRDLVGHSVHFG